MGVILPDHILKLMRPEDRAKLGKGGLTAAECQEIALAKSEKELQRQLHQLLTLNGVRFIINPRFGVKTRLPAGTPDFVFTFRGIPCAWEVKLPGQKPRPEQEQAMADMTADGTRCAVVRSYGEAKAFLFGLSLG